jgi:hypothetical protein
MKNYVDANDNVEGLIVERQWKVAVVRLEAGKPGKTKSLRLVAHSKPPPPRRPRRSLGILRAERAQATCGRPPIGKGFLSASATLVGAAMRPTCLRGT